MPPANVQAEQALLGALLANNRAYERVSEFLAPEHFAHPIHGRIYQAIARVPPQRWRPPGRNVRLINASQRAPPPPIAT
jgi:replicative DNA helicase